MRRFATVPVLALVTLLVAAPPSDARGGHGGGHQGGHHHFHHHHFGGRPHVFVGVRPFWWDPYPYWWDYPPTYYYAPPVVVPEPPVYIQQPTPMAPAAEVYWYYCTSAKAYYPIVQTCPEAWVKVPPRAP